MLTIREKQKLHSRQGLLDAGLVLRRQKRSFSNVSLREVTKYAGLVPTAFYRHFKDMDDFGAALVEQTSETLHQLIPRLKDGFGSIPGSKAQQSLAKFFRSVDENQLAWDFIIGERWGGSPNIVSLISRELALFELDLVAFLLEIPDFKNMSEKDLHILVSILLNLFMSWGVSWLNHLEEPDQDKQLQQRLELMQHVSQQVKLLFRGIANWRATPEPQPVK